MANIRRLVRAEQHAQQSLKAALAKLESAKRAVNRARDAWMRSNKALIEEKVREELRKEK
jgi:hypothetical protein